MVRDQGGVDVQPEQPKRALHRLELDVRQGDGLACDRDEPRRPIGQLGELLDQGIAAVGGLLERTPRKFASAGPPPTRTVPSDPAGLHLDHEDAALGVADHDVRLAATVSPALAKEPLHVREDGDGIRQNGAEAFVHQALGASARGVVGRRAFRRRSRAWHGASALRRSGGLA